MSFGTLVRVLTIAAVMLGWGRAGALAASAYEDLYTTFTVNQDRTALNWATCGTTKSGQDCFDSGVISHLTGACSILEGRPTAVGAKRIRNIYILDAKSDGLAHAELKIYVKTDTIKDNRISTSVTLSRTLPLAIKAGADAECFMAANAGFMAAGTNLTKAVVKIDKASLVRTPIKGRYPLSDITANNEGYILVTFSKSGSGEHVLIAPDGAVRESDSGAPTLPNPIKGVSLINCHDGTAPAGPVAQKGCPV